MLLTAAKDNLVVDIFDVHHVPYKVDFDLEVEIVCEDPPNGICAHVVPAACQISISSSIIDDSDKLLAADYENCRISSSLHRKGYTYRACQVAIIVHGRSACIP